MQVNHRNSFNYERLQASVAIHLRPSLFGILHNTSWYLATDVSGRLIGPVFKGQYSKKNSVLSLKMGPVGRPKTSVSNIPEEHMIIKYT